MRDDVRQALAIDRSTAIRERTIDITTTGRRSGEPRRIETNLTAEPHLVVHLKHGVVADLPATATVITDPSERRRVFPGFVEDFNRRNGSGSQWGQAVLEDWVSASPLAKISFDDAD